MEGDSAEESSQVGRGEEHTSRDEIMCLGQQAELESTALMGNTIIAGNGLPSSPRLLASSSCGRCVKINISLL